MDSWSHHGHFEAFGVEGSDFPVAADIVDELHQSVQPEHPRDDQHKDHKRVVTDTVETFHDFYKQ